MEYPCANREDDIRFESVVMSINERWFGSVQGGREVDEQDNQRTGDVGAR